MCWILCWDGRGILSRVWVCGGVLGGLLGLVCVGLWMDVDDVNDGRCVDGSWHSRHRRRSLAPTDPTHPPTHNHRGDHHRLPPIKRVHQPPNPRPVNGHRHRRRRRRRRRLGRGREEVEDPFDVVGRLVEGLVCLGIVGSESEAESRRERVGKRAHVH